MEQRRCKSPAMPIKQIWIYLLACNLTHLIMAQSALLADRLTRQLSLKHTLQPWTACTQQGIGTDDEVKLAGLFVLMAQQQVSNCPWCCEPSAVKSNSAVIFFYNMATAADLSH